MESRRVPLLLYAALLVVYSWATLAEQSLVADSEFYRHLASGREFMRASIVPRPDPFLWSVEVAPDLVGAPTWPPTTWLADAVFYLLHAVAVRSAGALGSTPFAVATDIQGIAVMLGSLAVFRLCSLTGASAPSAILGALVFAFVSQPLWRIGPESWLLVLVPSGVLYLEKRTTFSMVQSVIAVMLLANTTDSAFLLPFAVLLLAAGSMYAGERRRAAREFALFLPLVAFGATVNPRGGEWLTAAFLFVGSGNSLLREASGWGTPNFHTFPEIPLGIVAMLTSLLFGRCEFPRRWVPFLLTSLALSLLSIRFLLLLAIAVAVALSWYLSEWLQAHRRIATCLALPGGVGGAIVFFVLFLFLEQKWLKEERRDLSGRLDPLLPALTELHTAAVQEGRSLRLFNDRTLGGELAWYRIRGFVDDRPWGIYDDLEKLVQLREGWDEVLRRWEFNAAVIRRHTSLFSVLTEREGWREVAAGPSLPRIWTGRPIDYGITLLVKPERCSGDFRAPSDGS